MNENSKGIFQSGSEGQQGMKENLNVLSNLVWDVHICLEGPFSCEGS